MRLASAPPRAPAAHRARCRRPPRRRLAPCSASTGWQAHASPPFTLPPVHVARDAAEAEELLSRHVVSASAAGDGDASPLVLGFDTESRPLGFGGNGRLALLQLATPQAVVLLPLLRFATPPSLARLLSRPALLCGVSSHEDAVALAAAAPGARLRAVAVDVSTAAARHGCTGDDRTAAAPRIGLAALVAALGGPVLAKPRSVTLSNWEKWPLREAQVSYAALDAFASGWAACALHAQVQARAGGSAEPLGAWLRAEAATQAEEREAQAARSAAAMTVLLAAAAERPAGQRRRELVAVALRALPDETQSYLTNQVKKLIKRAMLLEDMATYGVKPKASSQKGA